MLWHKAHPGRRSGPDCPAARAGLGI